MYSIKDAIIESCRNRYFEYKVAEYLDKKKVNPPVYLSVGTEYIPPILKLALRNSYTVDYAIFPQHRCHSYFLTFSENRELAERQLRDELCGKITGCGNGMTGSASLHIPNVMFGHDGLLGSNAAIACGFAQATRRYTICILGDAACEEDYVLAALGYASHHKLPILFLVEDNNLSILTEKNVRRSWDIFKVSSSLGIGAADIDGSIEGSINALTTMLHSWIGTRQTCLVNLRVCRHLWHAGSGNDGPPRFDTLKEYKKAYNIKQSDLFDHEIDIDDLWRELDAVS